MNAPRSGCPINLTLEALGDRWSLIVIRDGVIVLTWSSSALPTRRSTPSKGSEIRSRSFRKMRGCGVSGNRIFICATTNCSGI